jgi:choline-sulfatase
MRILFIDIDSQRPDHLGCYGYHRDTSPNIDRIARQGVRFDNVYVTDAPCLPSRTALFSGRAGIHTGVINHGGRAADPFPDGASRRFRNRFGTTGWMQALRRAGLRTATISPFGERHSAWHWYAGFNDIHNTGRCGMECADEISPVAIDWVRRNGRQDNWFLHLNFWDPHTPYRAPAAFGDPFKDQPVPGWLTEQVRRGHWQGCGPHSAREIPGYADTLDDQETAWPRQPVRADSMDAVRMMFDGYDTGVRYADEHIGRVFNALADQGVLDDTAIIISADHGENLGELNIYGDHQTADHITSRVPLILRWPGLAAGDGGGRVDAALHYQHDLAATVIELAGGVVPDNWDGVSFAGALRDGAQQGREFLVVSQGAWSCQRAVRFEDFICIRSYHDGYHGFADIMLFDLRNDPHEQHDLASSRPQIVARAMTMLEQWHAHMMRTATHPADPMWTVLREGGPFHTRGRLAAYLERLRATGRAGWADTLAARHSREL